MSCLVNYTKTTGREVLIGVTTDKESLRVKDMDSDTGNEIKFVLERVIHLPYLDNIHLSKCMLIENTHICHIFCITVWLPPQIYDYLLSLESVLQNKDFQAKASWMDMGTSGHLVPSPHFGTCFCSSWWDQITRTCHVFTRLFTSNTPWYFLDFLLKKVFKVCGCNCEIELTTYFCIWFFMQILLWHLVSPLDIWVFQGSKTIFVIIHIILLWLSNFDNDQRFGSYKCVNYIMFIDS